MASFLKRKSSNSIDGKSIKVAATATPGTLIHTAVAGTTLGTFDEIWLWAYNGHTSDGELSIEEGSGDSLPMKVTIPCKVGWIPIEPGFILQNAVEIRAFAQVTNVIKIRAFVNTITD
ncbi:MAG: hypothetical protein Q8J68_14705 [Methanolobus sp.]|uniref:hypothetical protein n=1 Tax=Methanolobus sp. TaxID=1874737 RepID=UPI002730C461|nr:hypothetical protein [Methanolobus sp.]MDP2218525.1 hypothetical protein [Methanolobus sp.]